MNIYFERNVNLSIIFYFWIGFFLINWRVLFFRFSIFFVLEFYLKMFNIIIV